MRSDIVVVSTPAESGARFALLRLDAMFPVPPFSSVQEWCGVFTRRLEDTTLLSEDGIRAQLLDLDLSSQAIDDHIRRARNLHALNRQMATTCERTTAIGYRNDYGQEVVRKTNAVGRSPDQRVYIVQCGQCGHEYTSEGSELHRRRCPHCDPAP